MEIEVDKKVLEIDVRKLRSFEHISGGKVKLYFFNELPFTVRTEIGIKVLEEFKKYLQSRVG